MAKRISVLEGARETMRWAGAGRVMVRCRPSVRVSGKVGAGAVVAVAWEALTTGAGRVACAAWVLQANRDRARISKEESAKRFIFDLLIRLNKNPCAQAGESQTGCRVPAGAPPFSTRMSTAIA